MTKKDTQGNAHKLKKKVSSFGFFKNQKPQTKNPKPIKKIIINQCSPCEIAFIKDRTKK